MAPSKATAVNSPTLFSEKLGVVVLVLGVRCEGIGHREAIVACLHHVSAVTIRPLPLLQSLGSRLLPGRYVFAEGRQAMHLCPVERIAPIRRNVVEIIPGAHVLRVAQGCLPQPTVEF